MKEYVKNPVGMSARTPAGISGGVPARNIEIIYTKMSAGISQDSLNECLQIFLGTLVIPEQIYCRLPEEIHE